MSKPHIVIIGAGFGGVYTARFLKPLLQKAKVRVTLISRENYFLFTPLLHEVAGGGLSPRSVTEPIREIFDGTGVRFIEANVSSINPADKTLKVDSETISYDYLVLSAGATTNFYGVRGAEQYSYTLKNVADALHIRRAIITACERASRIEDPAMRKQLLSCVVIGGGPSGVELAAELMEFMRGTLAQYFRKTEIRKEDMSVTILASSSKLLPQFPKSISNIARKKMIKLGIRVHTNTKVTEIDKKNITLENGKVVSSEHIIWVAGVTPLNIKLAGGELDVGKRFVVDPYLRLTTHKDIFALGDIACSISQKAECRLPMLAQVAAQQARTVAINLRKSIENRKLQKFVYREKGILISLGQWSAAGEIFGITMSGPLMWLLWRTVYLFNFHSWRKRLKIVVEWTVGIFQPRDISIF